MKYECKENDCLIEMGKDKSEILISVKGETAKTVIGLKDLSQALILFGVGNLLNDKKNEKIEDLEDDLKRLNDDIEFEQENPKEYKLELLFVKDKIALLKSL